MAGHPEYRYYETPAPGLLSVDSCEDQACAHFNSHLLIGPYNGSWLYSLRTSLASIHSKLGGFMRKYLESVDRLMRQKPFLRHGQALMIVLKETSPAIHRRITGTDIDPSYRDDRISSFMSKLSRMWPDSDRADEEIEEITINVDLSWPFL